MTKRVNPDTVEDEPPPVDARAEDGLRSCSKRELKLTAALYAHKHWVVDHVRATGRLPEKIDQPGAHIGTRLLIEARGTDITLTPDEELVFEAILRDRRLPGGAVRLVEPESDESDEGSGPSSHRGVVSDKSTFAAPLRVLTKWELHAFVDAAEGDPSRALIQFLAFTGVHLGEALALRWQDVDLERGSAYIWRSLRLNRERPPRFGRRRVDLPTRLVRTLDQLDCSDELVFPDLFREFVRARRVRRVFRRLSRRAGLSRVNPYVLRHSWANGMLNLGVPLDYVSRALGHKTTALTARIYRRPLPERR